VSDSRTGGSDPTDEHRRIAKFTQEIGACTDAPDTPTPEDDAMPCDRSIVDLGDRHTDGRGLPGPARSYDADAREAAAV
jgi:hypothetical protein